VSAHVGGNVGIGPDGMLYVSIGDGAGLSAKSVYAQDLDTTLGTTMRLTPDGRVPDDNPFARSLGADPRVFAYGFRNPFGFTFDSASGNLWAADAGPGDSDEVNRVEAGRTYGWPLVVGWAHETPFGLPLAIVEHPITPTGLAVYHGAMFPEWEGDLLFCSFTPPELNVIDAAGLASEKPAAVSAVPANGCVTDIAVAPDGAVLLLDFIGGSVQRVAR
jgi:glucose/arabinose dehydrogenase